MNALAPQLITAVGAALLIYSLRQAVRSPVAAESNVFAINGYMLPSGIVGILILLIGTELQKSPVEMTPLMRFLLS